MSNSGMGSLRNRSSSSCGAQRTRFAPGAASSSPNAAPIIPGRTRSLSMPRPGRAGSLTDLSFAEFRSSPGTFVHVGSKVMSRWLIFRLLAMSL